MDSVDSHQELYKCLKLAISSLSSQVFFLIVQVFDPLIQQLTQRNGSFWDAKFGAPSAIPNDLFPDNSASPDEKCDYSLFHYACSAGNFEVFSFIKEKI